MFSYVAEIFIRTPDGGSAWRLRDNRGLGNLNESLSNTDVAHAQQSSLKEYHSSGESKEEGHLGHGVPEVGLGREGAGGAGGACYRLLWGALIAAA